MNKVILFDWGGVLENHENNMKELDDAKIRLIKYFNPNLNDDAILDRFTYKTFDGRNIGELNDEKAIRDWVNFIQKRCNINVSFDEFKNKYQEEFDEVSYYQDVADYAHSLKDKCKIGILSNLSPFDKVRIDKEYDLSKFDYVYLSFEIGIRKPNKKVFEYVLNDLKIDAKNILFIDDRKDNIDMAKKYGINTCLAYGNELDKIKLEVNNFLK